MTTPMPSAFTGSTLISELSSICVFDLETTGVDVFGDRIVTAYLGRINLRGEVTGSYSWLVNPGVPISEGAAAIHGISDEVAERDGQDAKTAIGEMLTILRRSIDSGRPTVAYNASFDLSMLNAEAVRYGYEPIDYTDVVVIDPYVIDKAIDRYRKGKRQLVVTARHYGVQLDEAAAHDAEADAVATGRVAWAVLAKCEDVSLAELYGRQIGWAADQAASFQEYKRRTEPEFVADGRWPLRSAPLVIAEPADDGDFDN